MIKKIHCSNFKNGMYFTYNNKIVGYRKSMTDSSYEFDSFQNNCIEFDEFSISTFLISDLYYNFFVFNNRLIELGEYL